MVTAAATVVLGFDCGVCGGAVAATLRCQGDLGGLAEPPCVPLDCPHCGRTNDVTFDAAGEVLAATARVRRPSPEPNWN